jgi:outer membrane receptor protein involved in Fe transport
MGNYGYVDAMYTGIPDDESVEFDDLPTDGAKFGPALWTSNLTVDHFRDFNTLGSLSARLAYTKEYKKSELFNGRISWYSPDESITIALWADNIFDTRDVRRGTGDAYGLDFELIQAREPRTYGVNAKYLF